MTLTLLGPPSPTYAITVGFNQWLFFSVLQFEVGVNVENFQEGYLQNHLWLNSDNFSIWGAGLILLEKYLHI